MPRISKDQMIKDEEKVIKLLTTRANESIDRIAKQCGFSRQKVWRIIKKLEENHTIWGYHAVVDEEKMEMKTYVLLMKASVKPMKNFTDLAIKREAGILGEKMGIEVVCSLYLHGTYDWLTVILARDTKHALQYSHLISRTYPDYIEDLVVLESMFPMKKCGFLNPNMEKLRDFELFDE